MKKILLLFTLAFSSLIHAQSPNDLVMCDSDGNGNETFDLTTISMELLNGLEPEDYIILFFETQLDAQNISNTIVNPESYVSIGPAQIIWARVTEIGDPQNYYIEQFNLIINPTPDASLTTFIIIDNADDNPNDFSASTTLIVLTQAVLEQNPGNNFNVNFYSDITLTSPITTPNVTGITGTGIYYQIENEITGCSSVGTIIFNVLPGDTTPPPSGESVYYYSSGETLANIPLTGTDIQWYETETGDTPLPLSTLLTNGTTYFAAQTINNIESAERFDVTVHILMGTDSNKFTDFSYYPNPVKNTLNLKNTNIIDTVAISTLLGQNVFSKTINDNNTQIDLSSLGMGVYFVTITSETSTKTTKIIKE